MFPVSMLEDLLCVVVNYQAYRRSLGEHDRIDLEALAEQLKDTIAAFSDEAPHVTA